MDIFALFNNLSFNYHRVKTFLLYRPFIKKISGKFVIINPILFTPRYLIVEGSVFIRNHARIEGINYYEGKSFNPQIILNKNVSIEQNLHLTCAVKIEIGQNTAIAAHVTITDINHPYKDISRPIEKQMIETKEVFIAENCKVYNNAVILPGATIGKHSIIAANSVVTGKKYPDHCVIAGSPAIVIKRFNTKSNQWEKTTPNGDFIT